MDLESGDYSSFVPSQVKIANLESVNFSNNELNNIEFDVLENRSNQNYDLSSLFNQKDFFEEFINSEVQKIKAILKKSCEEFMAFFEEKKIPEDRLCRLEEEMKMGRFFVGGSSDEPVNSFFDLKSLKKNDFPFFIKKMHSLFIDHYFQNLKKVGKSFREFLDTGRSITMKKSVSQKSVKKVPWSKQEESELLDLMQNRFPGNLSSKEVQSFCLTYNRTKSAINSKCAKLKKKYNGEFLKKSEEIIKDSISDYHNENTEDMILTSLRQKGNRTYDQLLVDLNVESYDTNLVESVDKVLYDLLNNQLINCTEEVFVILRDNIKDSKPDSVLTNYVVDIIQRSRDGCLSFKTIKNRLIERFTEIDPSKRNIDHDLREFFGFSDLFFLQTKRVFHL